MKTLGFRILINCGITIFHFFGKFAEILAIFNFIHHFLEFNLMTIFFYNGQKFSDTVPLKLDLI